MFLLLVFGLHDPAGLESPDVLKGSHKPLVQVPYLHPREALQI